MAGSADRVANIDDRGARRRRTGGYVWSAISVIALAAFLLTCSPRSVRLTLFVPLFMAALGFEQARERT